MGVIQRQVFKNNIVALISIGVGAISQIYIYTLDLETKGYADALLKWARLLSPFFLLGTASVMIRFLPYIEKPKEVAAASLFTRALLVVTMALAVPTIGLLLFGKAPLEWLDEHWVSLGYLAEQPWPILGLLACFCYALVLTTNLVNYHRIAVPVLFNSLLPKLGLPLLILMVVYLNFNRFDFTVGLVVLYFLTILGLYIYTVVLKKHSMTLAPLGLSRPLRKQLYALAGFSILGSIGTVFSTHIDVVFVNTYLGDKPTAVYGFAVFASAIMFIPNQAINSITGPIVAEAWKERKLDKISYLYRESAKVLFAVGGYIYVGGLLCMPFLFELTPKTGELRGAFLVFVLLGGAQLVDLLTSINGTIISNSDYFRWNMVFVVVLGVFNLGLNYLFVVSYDLGIMGAALATLVSLLVYNFLKVMFVQYRFKTNPFSGSLLFSAAALLLIYLIVDLVPPLSLASPIFDILLRGGLTTLLFFAYVRYTNGVPQLKQFLKTGINPFST
jgi:O-antigen/teichoic acid export membrane protein